MNNMGKQSGVSVIEPQTTQIRSKHTPLIYSGMCDVAFPLRLLITVAFSKDSVATSLSNTTAFAAKITRRPEISTFSS
jgi:hypothetical protein